MARRGRTGEAGFALLIVLWAMALLALLAAQVTGAGRAETRTAAALRSGAELQAAADAAVNEAIWHLLDGSGEQWTPEDPPHVLREAAAIVSVTLIDERGKIDINQAPPTLMQALFATLGADQSTAEALGNAVNDWHTANPGGDTAENAPSEYKADGLAWGPPGQEFDSLDELKLVHGMTPALFAAALPHLTLDLEQGPWTQFSDPVVIAALAKAKRDSGTVIDAADDRGPVVLRIVATARGADGAAFIRRAMVRLDGSLSGSAWRYRILAWEDGA